MVSGAPRSNLYEVDNTQTWTEQSGLGVYLGLVAPAGPLTPQYIPDMETLKQYTLNDKFSADDDVSFAVAKRLVNTTGLGLWVNRVANDDVLFGGCTVPCGTTRQALPLSIGLANPQDITFNNSTSATAEKIQVQTRNDVNGNTGGTAFYLQGHDFIISFAIEATQEVNTFVVNSDVNGNLNNKFFVLPSGLGYVWFDVNNAGSDPGSKTASLTGLTGYKVSFATNASANDIASAINTVLGNVEGVSSSVTDNAVTITVQSEGVTTSGNSGSSGFKFVRTSIGYNAIPSYSTTEATVKTVTITRNMVANDIASAMFTLLTTDSDLSGAFTSSLVDNMVTITSVNTGLVSNAMLVADKPAPVVIRTVTQGSATSGSDVLFLYFNNPSEKANNYGIKLFNCEDYPNIAPQEGTFVIEVYKKSNPRNPESTVTCTRDKALKDSYNNTMYVKDVLEKLTNIRAIDNTDVPSNELPQSIPDILWFGGGNSGSPVTLSNYISAVQPMVDREQYRISLLLPAGYYATAYVQELDRIAAKRGEAVAITGVPTSYETSVNYLKLIPQWINDEVLLTDSYSAIFSPAVIAYDADQGRNITLPVETCVAEQIAFANENYSIAEPILGFARGTLQNIQGVVRKYSFSDDGTADGDILYDNRINPIRYFNNNGYVIWGQKTTQRTTSARDRLNVRLMLTALKPLLNNIQLGLVGELPTQATRKRSEGLLDEVFKTGVSRNWFKSDYQIELVDDPALERQHIQRINYQIVPWYSIEYVQGYIILQNNIVTQIV